MRKGLFRFTEKKGSIAFLTDTFKHLNDLNLKLQCREKLMCDLIAGVECFSRKIDLLCEDVKIESLNFPNFKTIFDDYGGKFSKF